MTDTFERGISFNPMRLKEEITSIQRSMDRLELLLNQYKTRLAVKGCKKLLEDVRLEAAYLKNSWQDMEDKMKSIDGPELPYYFLQKPTKTKIEKLLEEASTITQ